MNESSCTGFLFATGGLFASSPGAGDRRAERAAAECSDEKSRPPRRRCRTDALRQFFPKIISRSVTTTGTARKPALAWDRRCTRNDSAEAARLRLVTQTLLVAILLHALTTLVFGDLRFSSFFQGTHKALIRMPVSRSAMQASDAPLCNRLLSLILRGE